VSEGPAPIGVLLRATPPDRLPELVAEHLRQHFGAERVEILLADLTVSGLWPLLDPDGPGGGTLAQRCFGSQRPVTDVGSNGVHRIHLPLTVWGERLGVLSVETAQPAGNSLTGDLTEIADELALALRAAGNDTDRYARVQRRARLTMAAELQWDLLPGRSLGDDRFLVAGQLEPAYDVHGDHFDWALNGDRLTVTVLNGHGDGMAAALLTTTAVNAMRNARRSGANLVEQAELASDAIWARSGTGHAATLLLEIDLISGHVEAVDAGSPRAMISREGDIHPVDLEQQLPLGMFGDSRYETQRFRLEPGDRLLVVSDGVHRAAPGSRSAYGESGLITALRRTRLQPATEAVGTVMRSLREYHAGHDPSDDAVIVCLDWRR
jgi:serine phosphatase RsbU (regulator of sigma subunit)